jgi:hypothetical protein
MTAEFCGDFCTGQGYPMFGTEYSRECFCGIARQAGSVAALEGDCNMACTGDVGEMCGGPSRLSVYVAEAPPPSGSTYSYQGCFTEATEGRALNLGESSFLATSCEHPHPSPSLSSYLSTPLSIGDVENVLAIANLFAFPQTATTVSDTEMTAEFCGDFCIGQGYPMFGTEYSRECFCGTARRAGSVTALEGDCNMACTGDAGEMCGGPSRLSVYLWST